MINRMMTTSAWIVVVSMLAAGCGPSPRELSDQQWLDLQQQMQQERAEVGQQRDQLEADRREWDRRERTEPVLAAVVVSAAMLIACGLPLIVVGILLWPRKEPPPSDAMCDVLIDEVALHVSEPKRIVSSSDPPKLAGGK